MNQNLQKLVSDACEHYTRLFTEEYTLGGFREKI